MRSIALWRAVWTIQARGNWGTPDSSHWRTAVAKASWAHSSARSKSPTRLMRVATIRPQSERYTASTAAAASEGIADCKVFMVGVSIWRFPIRFTREGDRHEIHVIDLYGRTGPEPGRA